ncbi:MAG: TolC family protein [Bradymonadales bacterium]|nr:TolC family protein [Bradymonadales bacterium]
MSKGYHATTRSPFLPGSIGPSLLSGRGPSQPRSRRMATLLAVLLIGLAAPGTPKAQESQPSIQPGPDARGEEQARPTLTLDQARETMVERNRDLAYARRSIDLAGLLRDRAVGTLLPRVDLQGQYTLRDEEVLFEMGNTYAPLLPYLNSVYNADPELQQYFADNPGTDARELATMEFEPAVIMRRHTLSGSLVLTQTLFNYRSFALLDLAEIVNQQSANGVEQARFQLDGALNRLYFGAVGLKRFIEVSQRNVELARLTFNRARIAHEEGVGNEFEVTRAQVALSRAERDLENAVLTYRLAISSLALLLDIPDDFEVVAPPPLDPPENLEVLQSRAWEQRPEVVGWDLAMEYGQRYIDENRAQFWPTLMAQGIMNLQQASAFGGDEFSWMVVVTASWNLYDGGLRSIETRNRELLLEQSSIRREQGQQRLANELQQAWMNLESQQRQVESARSEVELAQANLELSQTAWELGAATELEVEYAREGLFLSELALASLEVQLQAQIYELYRLSGEGY